MTQFELGIAGSIRPVAISAFNFTCVMAQDIATNTFQTYVLNPTG
jgi:hypothetical protein